jgi:hypothetical protein
MGLGCRSYHNFAPFYFNCCCWPVFLNCCCWPAILRSFAAPAVRFIDLPLTNNGAAAAVPEDSLEIAAKDKHVDEADVSMLTQQGLSRADALASWLLGGGSTDGALDCAFTCQDLGGAAKVWADMQPVRAVGDVLQASEVSKVVMHTSKTHKWMWRHVHVCWWLPEQHGSTSAVSGLMESSRT